MKIQEKDKQRAREFVETEANKDLQSNAFIFIKSENVILTVGELEEYLAMYVLHLESIGVIKFTENREQHPEFVDCSDFERKNCYYNKFCIGCGRKMPHNV